MTCPLCGERDLSFTPVYPDGQSYLHCRICDLRSLHPSRRLSAAEEKERYRLHQTDVADEGYRQFTARLIDCVRSEFPEARGVRGLDYGCGHQPVLAEHLQALGYHVEKYDPFFFGDDELLKSRYDFVTACEVIEHFYDPAREFARLRALTERVLILQTHLYDESVNFAEWYYRRDPTHVSFYSARTCAWLARRFGFSSVDISGRVVCLR